MRSPERPLPTPRAFPFSLSTMGTASIEDVKAANPNGRNWFQLYMWTDRDRSMALVDRAAKAGFDTLLVTVGVPVAGARLLDARNGMTIPPTLTPKTVLNALPRPAWWINFLTTEPLAIEILSGQLVRTMQLFGVNSLDELEPGHVTQLQRLMARE